MLRSGVSGICVLWVSVVMGSVCCLECTEEEEVA